MLIAWIVAFALHSTVLLGLAWLVSRRLEHRPRAAVALWRAAMVIPLLSASAQVLMQPGTALSIPIGGHDEIAVLHSGVAPILEMPVELPALADVPVVDPDFVPEVPEALPMATGSVAAPAPLASWSWGDALGLTWAAGAFIGLLWVLAGLVRLRRQLVGRTRVVASWGPTALPRAPDVALAVAPRLQVPLVHGIVRPEVCVPKRALDELDSDALRAIVAHEVGHVVHRDPLWRLVGLVLERVFFFQPLLRVANRRLAAGSELLADAWAVGKTQRPLALAESLTVVAAWVCARRGPMPAPAMAGPRSQLRVRVERLIGARAGSVDPWPRWLAPALVVAVAGLVAFAPGVDAEARKKVRIVHAGASASVVRVHTDDDAAEPSVVVVRGDDVQIYRGDDEEAAEPQTKREQAKERRKAKKRVKKAFKTARKRGDLPTEKEILRALRGKRTGDVVRLDGAVVVVLDDHGRKAVVRMPRKGKKKHRHHAERHQHDARRHAEREQWEARQVQERQLREAERLLRKEQRRLEDRARALEELIERKYQRKLEKLERKRLKHQSKLRAPRPPPTAPSTAPARQVVQGTQGPERPISAAASPSAAAPPHPVQGPKDPQGPQAPAAPNTAARLRARELRRHVVGHRGGAVGRSGAIQGLPHGVAAVGGGHEFGEGGGEVGDGFGGVDVVLDEEGAAAVDHRLGVEPLVLVLVVGVREEDGGDGVGPGFGHAACASAADDEVGGAVGQAHLAAVVDDPGLDAGVVVGRGELVGVVGAALVQELPAVEGGGAVAVGHELDQGFDDGLSAMGRARDEDRGEGGVEVEVGAGVGGRGVGSGDAAQRQADALGAGEELGVVGAEHLGGDRSEAAVGLAGDRVEVDQDAGQAEAGGGDDRGAGHEAAGGDDGVDALAAAERDGLRHGAGEADAEGEHGRWAAQGGQRLGG